MSEGSLPDFLFVRFSSPILICYYENNDYGQEYVENREVTMSKVDEENYDANDYANMRIIMT